MLNRALVLILLLLAACGHTDAPPLAGARIGGPFALIDQDGRARTDRDFAGKYRIMYFGYTFCPDICPTDVANLAKGYRAFVTASPQNAARIVPIFITVDPARDTPAVLKQWTAAFDPALIGLTGTPDQIARVAQRFGVVYQAAKPDAQRAYLVDHSRSAYLMGTNGEPIMLLSQDGTPAVIAAELKKWVR